MVLYNARLIGSLAQLVEQRTLIRWSSVRIAHDPPDNRKPSFETWLFVCLPVAWAYRLRERMKKKLLSGIKFAVQTALVFLLVSLFLDWIRKPDEPAGAAGRPLTLLSGQRLTLGQFSRDKAVLVYFWELVRRVPLSVADNR